MSDEIHNITFNRNTLRLEMRFEGDDYQSATVKMRLDPYGPKIEEDVVIPVRCLFALGHLMLMSIRRTAAQYEKEAQEMVDAVELKKHPLKHAGGKNEEDKETKIKNK